MIRLIRDPLTLIAVLLSESLTALRTVCKVLIRFITADHTAVMDPFGLHGGYIR